MPLARLDEICLQKIERMSRFYPKKKNHWIFDQRAYSSEEWLCLGWVTVPESAISVQKSTFDCEVLDAGLVISKYYSGSWENQPGLFQDIVVFRTPDTTDGFNRAEMSP
jgi:hypothetical protein